MSLQLFQRVRLLSDRHVADGAKSGMVGYIIETYGDNAYEVEFSDSDGVTVAQILAGNSELEAFKEES